MLVIAHGSFLSTSICYKVHLLGINTKENDFTVIMNLPQTRSSKSFPTVILLLPLLQVRLNEQESVVLNLQDIEFL